jgi:hypothetical protein
MQMPQNNHPREEELEAPPKLSSALKRLEKPSFFIPRTVDEAILRAAHLHLTRPKKRKQILIVRWAFAMSAAAAVLVIIPRLLQKPGPAPARFEREDVNHDGRVDILDALILARQMKSGNVLGPQLDVNGDGLVDDRDVAAIAARAVRLDKGGRS